MRSIMILSILIFTVFVAHADAQPPYRIGYFEGGNFQTYQPTYQAVRLMLAELGWGTDKVEFVDDAHFSPGFNAAGRQRWNSVAEELLTRQDLDMLLLGGTAATAVMLRYSYPEVYCHTTEQQQDPACQGVLNLNASTRQQFTIKPMIAASVSDAVKAGFVPSQTTHYAGVDAFTVRIVPNRYTRMFEIFYNEIEFSKLGLLYQDTLNGRTYASLADAQIVAKRQGFEIVEATVSNHFTDLECQAALKSLIQQEIDAFFIPSLTCFEWHRNDVATLLELLRTHNVKTFARQGVQDVRAGALMSLSPIDYNARGQFVAERMIKILQGTPARDLPMVHDLPPKVALNLEVARQVGHEFSFGVLGENDKIYILGASEDIYEEIVLPEQRKYK